MDDVMYSVKDMTGKTKMVLIEKADKEETREANIIYQGIEVGIFEHQNGNMVVLPEVFIMVLKGLEIPFILQNKYNDFNLILMFY